MPGIYLHIPYCKKACSYCDFYFSTRLGSKSDFIEALLKEISLEKYFFQDTPAANQPISSIYFGGGTPSLLTRMELESILSSLQQNFSISPTAEITLEANPDDLTIEKINTLYSLGINRLSIGIQSFREEDLYLLNRSHTAQQATQCVKQAQDIGLTNISIDLIYNLPGLDTYAWKGNLSQALALKVPHISAYGLTVENGTQLAYQIKHQQVAEPNEDEFVEHFEVLTSTLIGDGYEHYEISNFSKPNFKALHNSAYWHRESYLGLGPSAHSYTTRKRSFNSPEIHAYIEFLLLGKLPPRESEVLDLKSIFNEKLMLGLRTAEGVKLADLSEINSYDWATKSGSKIQNLKSKGLVDIDNGFFKLTTKGQLLSDKIVRDLIII